MPKGKKNTKTQSFREKEWPDVGELVVGTVVRVERHGAYVILDEYMKKEGLIHISEISSSWIRNIRRFVREKQKVVARVLRVNPQKGHIDLSLRRVSQEDKKKKIQNWKRDQKAEILLRMAAEERTKLGEPKTIEDAFKEFGVIFKKKFGSIFNGFEEIKEKGESALKTLKIPENWIPIILKLAKTQVESPFVKVSGILKLRSFDPDGVEKIRDALIKAMELPTEQNTEIDIFLDGAPRYRLEVKGKTYKIAEKYLSKAAEIAVSTIKASGGEGTFSKKTFN
ncbi:MAG: translation initiation factor IF-2 subunit alpha [Candidatus Helarchaeota archaeon]